MTDTTTGRSGFPDISAMAPDRLWAAAELRERLGRRSEGDQSRASGLLPEVIDEVTAELGTRWLARADVLLGAQKVARARFEADLRSMWGVALDAFELFVVAAEGVGADFVDSHGPGDALYEVLVTLHARACQLGHEVHWNLAGGYPRAADARGRTLHEVVVAMRLLGERGRGDDPEIVTRYAEHELVGECQYYESLVAHHEAMGMAAPSRDVVSALRAKRKDLVAHYGKHFTKSFGWMSGSADETSSRASLGTIAAAEAAVGMSYMRPVYATQSDAIHAGAAAARSQVAERGPDLVRLTNATTRELGRAGYLATRSLLLATNVVIGFACEQAEPGFVVCMSALGVLAERAQTSFRDAQPDDT